MQSSATSFYSEKAMTQQQEESLKKATAKPFELGRKSSSNFKKYVEETGAYKENKVDDELMSEISTPDIDWTERKKIMDALARREKDREELDMDATFKELISKAKGVDNDDIESVASQTVQEYRQTGKVNIYKPTFKTGSTPRAEKDKLTTGPIRAAHPP